MRRRASGKCANHLVGGGSLLSMILRWRRWAHALRFSLAASACNGAAALAACSMMYVENLPSPFATLCMLWLTAVPPPPRRPLTPDAVRKHAIKTGVRSFSLRETPRRERSSLFCRHTWMVSLRRSNARVMWYMRWTFEGTTFGSDSAQGGWLRSKRYCKTPRSGSCLVLQADAFARDRSYSPSASHRTMIMMTK